RRHFVTLARVLRVSGNTDDLQLVGLGIVVRETLSNRVLIGEKLVREGLIHDHDFRRSRVVFRTESAAVKQRNTHHLEEVLAYCMAITFAALRNPSFRIRRGRQSFTQKDATRTGTLRKQRHARERNALHSRNTFETFAYLLINLAQLFVFVTDQCGLHFKQQKILRVEAWIDSLQIQQRAHKQSGANQQQQRQRHLDHNQTAAQYRTMNRTGATTAV